MVGQMYDQRKVMAELVAQQYKRLESSFQRGAFRVRGDSLEVWPAHLEDRAWRFSFFGEELESIVEFDPLTGAKTDTFKQIRHLCEQPLRHPASDAGAGDQGRSRTS
jgi:excinuclease ABC subunit B